MKIPEIVDPGAFIMKCVLEGEARRKDAQMKFTLSRDAISIPISFSKDDPGYEEIISVMRTAFDRLDRMATDEFADLKRLLPLPSGCAIARYVDGMREIVQYDVNRDDYAIRHDWIKEGRRMHLAGDPIAPFGDQAWLENAIEIRRHIARSERAKA